MTTLTIHIPDKKTSLVKQLLKELDVTIEPVVTKKNNHSSLPHLPNSETVKAIEDARKGKTKQITDFKAFFGSI
ncbi:MAG: hypothetical protein QM652_13975 [Legionella sp.]|uniref:hypothetical protein n=1 Tax=Legionella sp. TaxID=459 RepID=UPI0039E49169